MSLQIALGTPAPTLHIPHQIFLREAEKEIELEQKR